MNNNDNNLNARPNPKQLTSVSKFLSLVLRHEPQLIGLTLDSAGWTPVDALLDKASQAGRLISRELLQAVVLHNDKQRFAFSEDGQRIRANQGHSVDVALDLPAVTPPDALFHGTASRFLATILQEGLNRRARHHVHLTANPATAVAVGQRHGAPVVLRVDARRMASLGHTFHCSANGVWLTEQVPPEFIALYPQS